MPSGSGNKAPGPSWMENRLSIGIFSLLRFLLPAIRVYLQNFRFSFVHSPRFHRYCQNLPPLSPWGRGLGWGVTGSIRRLFLSPCYASSILHPHRTVAKAAMARRRPSPSPLKGEGCACFSLFLNGVFHNFFDNILKLPIGLRRGWKSARSK